MPCQREDRQVPGNARRRRPRREQMSPFALDERGVEPRFDE
jgi:hypothetical protein